MIKFMSTLLLGASLTACATTATKIEGADKTFASSEASFGETVRPIIESQDSNLELTVAMQRADKEYNREHYEKSFDLYQLVSLQDKTHTDAYLGWGNSAIALNLFEKAKEVFLKTPLEAASQEQKHDQLAGIVLAEVGTDTSEDEEVRLNEALEYNLDDARLWNALGRFHDNKKRYDLAERTYEKAMNVGEHAHSSVVNNLGMSLLKQKKYKQALAKFEQASEMRSDRALYDNNRRVTLVLMGRDNAATSDVGAQRKAQIFNDAGYVAMTHERQDLAKTLLQRSIELSPTYMAAAHGNLKALEQTEEKGPTPTQPHHLPVVQQAELDAQAFTE